MNKPDFQIVSREGTYFSYNNSSGICRPGFREKSDRIETYIKIMVTEIIFKNIRAYDFELGHCNRLIIIHGDYIQIPEEDIKGKVEKLLREHFWKTDPNSTMSGISNDVPGPDFFKIQSDKLIDDLLIARWDNISDLSSIPLRENDSRILRAFNGFKRL